MSSCSDWRTAKSDAQTTAHDRLDRTYGNTVRPIRHSAIQINRNRNREWLRPEAHHSRISNATRQMTSKAALALARIIWSEWCRYGTVRVGRDSGAIAKGLTTSTLHRLQVWVRATAFREIRDAFPDAFNHRSFAYSAFACLGMGMSGSRFSTAPRNLDRRRGRAVRLLRYHFEEERLRTESEHCTKSGH